MLAFPALGLPLALSLVGAAIAASTPKAPKAITSCVVPGTVALTFDDGPYKWQDDISKMLLDKGAKGTFFVNGDNYECIYSKAVSERLQRTFSAGHQICSHTWSHPDLTDLTEDEITDEFTKISDALKTILGVSTAYMRPPYGSYNLRVRQVAERLGQSVITWDFERVPLPYSIGANVSQSLQYYDAAIAARNISIALQHETEKTTVFQLLPLVIDKLIDAGYKLVTLAECLDQPMYTYIGSVGVYNKTTWFCPEDIATVTSSSTSYSTTSTTTSADNTATSTETTSPPSPTPKHVKGGK
ncbi:Carbohydrate esterase family 4 protein [Mycena kentingensis (nom. inval.)]|nr:Carbohydrate esterase family 4 protein [Mycena kentingensis (nom. inval.)]